MPRPGPLIRVAHLSGMMRWFWTLAFLFPIIPRMFDTFRSAIEHWLAWFSIPSPWGLELVDTLTFLFAGLSILFPPSKTRNREHDGQERRAVVLSSSWVWEMSIRGGGVKYEA